MKIKIIVSVLMSVLLDTEEMNGQGAPVNMSWVPPGSFIMGNIFSGEGLPEELPTRTVYINGFYMDKYEVTKVLWDEVKTWAVANGYSFDDPGVGKAANHPIQSVKWYDVVKWCNARSQKEGKTPAYYMDTGLTVVYKTGQVAPYVNWNSGFRLPTEAEWEKAARGGTSSRRFPWSDTDTITHSRANYYSTSRDAYDTSPTRGYHPTFNDTVYPYNSPVGYFATNGYGLYDMAGNVWEWCWDRYDMYSSDSQTDPRGPVSGSERVFRGGAWDNGAFGCRVAVRAHYHPADRDFRLGFRSVLAAGWRQVIETQPVQPTYSEPPKKEEGKRNIVIVTHGWQPAWKPVNIAWVETMTNAISQYLVNQGLTDWQVHAHRWVEKARPGVKFGVYGAKVVLDNGKEEGVNLGRSIANQQFEHVHLIAHSAGATLIQSISETIKALHPNTIVHLTFMDPFVGFRYEERGNYGKGADWTDNYFSTDAKTGGEFYQLTEGSLNHAYNVDVTWLDINREMVQVNYSTPSLNISQTCYQIVSSHGWPHEFYLKTITQLWPEANGFGFPLSKEGGNWDLVASQYRAGNDKPHVLGSGELSCVPMVVTPLQIEQSLEFLKLPETSVIINTSEKVNLHNTGLELRTGSPTWLALVLPITNRVNFVSFDAIFTSASGAEGLLSVYWGTNVISLLDERVTVPGTHQYQLPLPEIVEGETRTLGFRLDAFSTIQSSATVTNVALGFAGVQEPFSLSLSSENTNGSPILELVGPSGFNYRVESSTDLVDWSTAAILVNTNGVVHFIDPNPPTNHRFYRVVAP